jgi:hypothetical protein
MRRQTTNNLKIGTDSAANQGDGSGVDVIDIQPIELGQGATHVIQFNTTNFCHPVLEWEIMVCSEAMLMTIWEIPVVRWLFSPM